MVSSAATAAVAACVALAFFTPRTGSIFCEHPHSTTSAINAMYIVFFIVIKRFSGISYKDSARRAKCQIYLSFSWTSQAQAFSGKQTGFLLLG
jgi:hypothetical protein